MEAAGTGCTAGTGFTVEITKKLSRNRFGKKIVRGGFKTTLEPP